MFCIMKVRDFPSVGSERSSISGAAYYVSHGAGQEVFRVDDKRLLLIL